MVRTTWISVLVWGIIGRKHKVIFFKNQLPGKKNFLFFEFKIKGLNINKNELNENASKSF